jgi:solute carrier family 6 (neurotransmitter transporter, GABA) member 1
VFTSIFPLVLLTILLVKSLTLDGAIDGIIFLFYPDFSQLLVSRVWVEAFSQVFYSYAIGFGAMIALGSFNHYRNNLFKFVALK